MSDTPIRIEPPFGPTDRPRKMPEPIGPRAKAFGRRAIRSVLLLAVLLVLPFLLLVRSSVFLYGIGLGAGWVAILGGIVATALLLMAYCLVTGRRLTGTWTLPPFVRRGVLALVAAYAVYAVVYLAAGNAKTPDVREAYGAVSPVVRLATSTLVLVDPDLVVTDASRTLDDYRRMGLPPNEASLHFAQDDDWVYAVDLRTLGRTRIRNGLMAMYFWAMGFQTLRHRGTADHLHVALPTQGR